MRYNRFEEVPVWRAALELAKQVYLFGEQHRLRPNLRDQIERAALSVSNNIAEGFERGTTQEVITFIYIARGSAGEVRSMLCLLEELSPDLALASRISALKSLCESISRQLRAWAAHLQETSIKGQRYLTESGRKQREQDKARDEFEARLQELANQGRAEREGQRGPTGGAAQD